MFASFFVVLFIEAADQLLKDCAHRVVVKARESDFSIPIQNGPGAEVNGRIEEFFN